MTIMNKKVFVGGSRRITRSNSEIVRRLNSILDGRLSILIGDASGADKAIQKYLYNKQYDLVEVFCAGGVCRNNLGGWQVRRIPADGHRQGFGFYATKDRAMSDESAGADRACVAGGAVIGVSPTWAAPRAERAPRRRTVELRPSARWLRARNGRCICADDPGARNRTRESTDTGPVAVRQLGGLARLHSPALLSGRVGAATR